MSNWESLTVEELGRLRDQAKSAINEINYRGTLRHIKSIAITIGMTHEWCKASQIIDLVDAALGLDPKLPGCRGPKLAEEYAKTPMKTEPQATVDDSSSSLAGRGSP